MKWWVIRWLILLLGALASFSPSRAGLRDILPPPQQMGHLADEPLEIQGSLYLVTPTAPSVSEVKVITEAARLIELGLLVPPTIVSWSEYNGERPALWLATCGRLPALEAALDSVEIPAMSSQPPPEGYHLYVGSDRILLLGRDINGLRYGLLSLSRLMGTFAGMAFIDRVYIRDWPDLPRRMITINECLWQEGDLDKFYARIYQAYESKMNELEWNNKFLDDGQISIPRYRDRAIAARDSVRGLDMRLVMSADRTAHNVENPCWQEGVPVNGQTFLITSDTARVITDPVVPIINPDFEDFHNGEFDGWDHIHAPYPTITRDTYEKHHGNASAKIYLTPESGTDAPLLLQYVDLEPFRLYHVSFWYKTSGYSGKIYFSIIRPDCESQKIFCWFTRPSASSSWTQVTMIVHSLRWETDVFLIGASGAENGTLWIDNLVIEERNPIWILRRDDTPLHVFKEPGHIPLTEGDDFVIEESYWKDYGDCYIHYPTIRRVSGGRLANGNQISMDWYCAFRYQDRQTPCFSLLEPLAAYQQKIACCDSLFHPDGFKIHINEISLANWDSLCLSRNLTPAQIVGSYVRQMYNIIQAQRPGAPVQVYGDAFDPYHEGSECRRAINGSMMGSLFELPTTMCLLALSEKYIDSSLYYFSQHGYPSVSCHAGWNSMELGLKEAEAARRHAGCQGISFFTWDWDDFDDIPSFASMGWNLGPHIVHQPIVFTDSAASALITAEIYPDAQPASLEITLASETVHYRLLPGGTWQSAPLFFQGADLFSATINLTAPGTSGLEYYIEASDSRERTHSAPADAPFSTFTANFPSYGESDRSTTLKSPRITLSIANGQPVVRWTPVEGADRYEVHTSTDPSFLPCPATWRANIPAPLTVYVEMRPLSTLPDRFFYRVVAVDSHAPRTNARD